MSSSRAPRASRRSPTRCRDLARLVARLAKWMTHAYNLLTSVLCHAPLWYHVAFRNHISFRNRIIIQLPSMSPGEPISVEPLTPIATAGKASRDVEVQAALTSSTDDTTTTGAPVEKVCIYLFSTPAGDQASRWLSVGQPLGPRSHPPIGGDAESRTTTRVRDILCARCRPEFCRFHRAIAIILGRHSNARTWYDYREPVTLARAVC